MELRSKCLLIIAETCVIAQVCWPYACFVEECRKWKTNGDKRDKFLLLNSSEILLNSENLKTDNNTKNKMFPPPQLKGKFSEVGNLENRHLKNENETRKLTVFKKRKKRPRLFKREKPTQ